jgi:glycosyltransferase involved in cell wall biosynthesis
MAAEGRRKLISVITPVFNEEETVRRCHAEVTRVCETLSDGYDYEHIFADNCSTDRTLAILRELAAEDVHVKVLAYSRNFGAEKSGMMALRHCTGDAEIGIPADLQEPPDVLPSFVKKWEEGYEVVYGMYKNPHEAWFERKLRSTYYWLVDKLSPEPLPRDFSGFALIDRVVIDEVNKLDDFAPYFRGMVATVGFRQIGLLYDRGARKAGKSKHGFGFLVGFATNGIITHSLMPIRLATLAGSILSAIAVLAAIAYAIMKMVRWDFQAPGATTTVVVVLFFSGIQLLFLGMLGEYIGAIHSQVRRRPWVIVRERINFDAAAPAKPNALESRAG